MAYVSYEDRLEAAKVQIENGARFNGTVYAKNANKNNVDFSIYLDGQYINLGRISKEHATEYKKKLTKELCINLTSFPKQIEGKYEWLVNEKKVKNNLDWGQMWEKYGTDFE